MGTDDNNDTIDPTTPPTTPPAGGSDDRDPAALLKALQTERAAAKIAKDELADREKQLAEREAQLSRLKGIDPTKYQELLARQQQNEEEDLRKNKQWDTLKTNYEKQKSELTAKASNWESKYQSLLAQQAIKDAFVGAGGIVEVQAIDGEQIAPLDLVAQYFGNRIQVEDDRVTLLDRFGKPETHEGRNLSLTEKMIQLKRGSLGYLFQPESKHSGTGSNPSTIGPNGKQLIVYTQEQARSGKADMKKVASGEAVIR
jgi:hypothetical protein